MAEVNWNFIRGGYFDDEQKAVVREDLFTEHADRFGALFAARGHPLSSTQLRAFYGDAKLLEEKMKMGGTTITLEAFQQNQYLVRMLKAKVSYAQGKRTGQRVSREFRDYIHKCVDAIQDEKDFRAFMKFFESTVGFFFGHGGGRK